MSTFDFATIDSTRTASLKQIFAISTRFTPTAAETLGVSGVKINKILRPRITAVIQSMEPNHGMIQKWFKSKTCPKAILDLIKTEGLSEDEPKASKKSKTSKKPKASAKVKTSPKASEEPEAPKQAIQSPVVWKTTSKSDEFSQRLTVLEAMQSQTSEDVQSIKSSMESLVATLNGLNS